MMIAPPPRCFMCGTAMRDARIAGKSVSSNAACHSASVVPSRSEPAARPTLFTRTSRPPNASTAVVITSSIPGAVETSAWTVLIMFGRFAAASTSSAASASCSPPRAQMRTRQPSATRARALARPSPRLEPVTTATLSVRPRSIETCAVRHAPSLDAPAGQVVQAPIHFVKHDAELVLLHEILFEREEMRRDERDDGALDRRALREYWIRLVGIGRDEIRFAPAEDRRDRHLARQPVDMVHVTVGAELRLAFGELFLEAFRGICLAAQPSAAERAAAEREIEARLLELRKDRLLDLVERYRAAGGTKRVLVEGAGDLLDGALHRVVIDDGLQHECVVGVQPERHLLRLRPCLIARCRHVERGDVAIQASAV